MTPLVKSMLKTKQRIPPHRYEKLKVINERIWKVICQNRRNFKDLMGSRNWRKNVEIINHSDPAHHLELH